MSEEQPLYQKITEWIRKEIIEGRLGPGDRLPAVREMAESWGCTPGTIQRAYRQLAEQGLLESRPGQGTFLTQAPVRLDQTALRRVNLLHRAESFLLETMAAGYQADEVENAIRLALDHWRVIQSQPEPAQAGVLRFMGSHDPALARIATKFAEIAPGYHFQLGFCGSLRGLIALAEGNADLAGSHLWDKESDTYNASFVRRLLPGKRVALITFAHRRLGLILAKGNPLKIQGLKDLTQDGLTFVNRQPGSGTRVWLDAALQSAGIDAAQINGYGNERMTHTDVAVTVSDGKADAGFGLETAALDYGLDFVPLVRERYDLVVPEENLAGQPLRLLVDWLGSEGARRMIEGMGGYESGSIGEVKIVA